jgi:NADH-quinone oxidoreductase subunit J
MQSIPIYPIIFYFFATLLVIFATVVVVSRNTVYSVLALIFCFVCSSVLWMLLRAEFLALMLIFVYVGAVMTLMLFVVMMLNIDLEKMREKFTHVLPLSIVVLTLLVAILTLVFHHHLPGAQTQLPTQLIGASNTQSMGTLLFTKYLYPFEIAGMILLVAMVAAISLAFFGRKPGTKSQNVQQQHLANKADRMTVVKMKVEKR